MEIKKGCKCQEQSKRLYTRHLDTLPSRKDLALIGMMERTMEETL